MTKRKPGGKDARAVATLRLTRRFAATRTALFRAWTEPEALTRWFGPEGIEARNVKVDLRVGGGYSLEMRERDGSVYPLSGVYCEVNPPERLVFTWVWSGGDFAGVETLVTLEFAEVAGGSELTLTHERLPGDRARVLHEQGWASTLNCLDAFLERES